MTKNDYWAECIAIAAEECGAVLTNEQRAYIADAVEGAHESYGMAFYQPPSPLPGEIKRLEGELRKERSKVACRECGGEGRLRYNVGSWGVNTGCDKCRGEGKHLP